MAYLLKWTEQSDGSFAATTHNGKTYRVVRIDDAWWALAPYDDTRGGPHDSSITARYSCDAYALELEGPQNVL
ncbi:hypothetical protein [Cellulomonas sp. URHD0024]|uniref:hypothetical protein n=1 Tax=Cellulomonas sp. URHD0024 TaxID=1302620 RepID=UPI0004293478|nr:hypothetical protein [Cellulomonas sp. URHD0024]